MARRSARKPAERPARSSRMRSMPFFRGERSSKHSAVHERLGVRDTEAPGAWSVNRNPYRARVRDPHLIGALALEVPKHLLGNLSSIDAGGRLYCARDGL